MSRSPSTSTKMATVTCSNRTPCSGRHQPQTSPSWSPPGKAATWSAAGTSTPPTSPPPPSPTTPPPTTPGPPGTKPWSTTPARYGSSHLQVDRAECLGRVDPGQDDLQRLDDQLRSRYRLGDAGHGEL